MLPPSSMQAKVTDSSQQRQSWPWAVPAAAARGKQNAARPSHFSTETGNSIFAQNLSVLYMNNLFKIPSRPNVGV